MATPDNETVEYDILIQATLALKNLADLTNATRSFNDQIMATTMQVKSSAKEWGVSFQQAKNTLQGLDKEISGTAESSVVFGGRGQEAWNKVSEGADKAGAATKRAGETTEKSTKSMVSGINLVRIALHVLATSAIFAVIAGFTKLFQMAITGLREMETGIYNLVNAERKLSEQGVEITPQDLDNTIKKLQEINPLLSKIQATELVSRVGANVATAVGLSAEEIEQLSRSIAVLSVRNKGLGKSFEEVESQVTNAFLSGRVSTGINQLGVKITDQIVKDEALRMGLVKTADEFDNLTGKMASNIKARAMLSVLAQNTNEEQKYLPEYLKTADAAFGRVQARFQDLLTLLGKDAGPAIATILNFIADSLEGWIMIFERLQPFIKQTVAGFVGIAEAFKEFLKADTSSSLGDFQQRIKDAFNRGFDGAMDSLREFGDYADTETADIAEEVAVNLEKAAEEFDKFKEKLEDIMLDFRRKMEDLDINYQRKLEDLDIEYDQKGADAYRDYIQKLEDIDVDYNDRVQDIRTQARNEEARAERDHLRELERLRQQYLMDLEEALRNRDARQVLKLQKEYQMNRDNLEQQREDERESHAQQVEQEIKDAKKDRERRIRDAKIEYDRKLEDLRIAKQREYEEIVRWRQREEDDLQRAAYRRITDLINEYMQSEFFTQEHLNNLLAMVQSFANEIGATWSGIAASTPSLNLNLNPVSGYSEGGGLASDTGSSSTGGTIGSVTNMGNHGGRSGLAEGGTFLATRPSTISVAEKRPEIISAMPLGTPGSDISKFFTDMNINGQNGDSRIKLRIMLSDGLIADIVDDASTNVATTIEKIMRER